MTTPVVALLALELGASLAVAGIVVALRGLVTMLFDVPAGGVLVAPARRVEVGGPLRVALAPISTAVWQRPSLLLYAVLTTVIGCTWAMWLLARMAFAACASPIAIAGG